MIRLTLFVMFVLSGLIGDPQEENYFRTDSGKVSFRSVAPLETIMASSDRLKGIIDTAANTFAFSVNISSFQGFNSPLQREHFNENYLETELYPAATFSGKIIEVINYSVPGTYPVRAKGVLAIHGIKAEKLIKSTLEVKNGTLVIHSAFVVVLRDFDVKIPRIVHQKISPEIDVTVDAILKSSGEK